MIHQGGSWRPDAQRAQPRLSAIPAEGGWADEAFGNHGGTVAVPLPIRSIAAGVASSERRSGWA